MATQQAFSPQFPSPALAPDLLRQQYQTQQAQQYAQALLQDGQQIPQGQMVSGHYVAPSWAQYLGQGLKTYLGTKLQNQIPDRLANMQRTQQAYGASLFGLNPTPQQFGAALRDGGQAGQAPAQTFPVGPSGTPQQPTAPQPSEGYTGSMPLLPGRTPAQSYQIYSLLGPQKYMEQVAQQGSPTDVVKNMVAAGLDPNSAQGRAYLANLLNKNASNLVNVRPGGTVFDANAGAPLYHAPGTNGVQVVETPQGPAMHNVPGSIQATAAASQAQASGPAAFRTSVVNLPNGQNVMMTDTQKNAWLTDADKRDPYLMAVMSTESGGSPNAVSPKGAVGSMQTMPGTLSNPGFGVTPAQNDSPEEAGRVGRDYWNAMTQKYGNPTLAAIAYNMGPGRTDQWLQAGGDFAKLPAETKNYVSSVMTKAAVSGVGQQRMPGQQVQGEGTIAANQQLGKDQAKELMTSRASAINATDDLTNITQARKAISAGTFGGSGAQAKLNAAKFFQSWIPGMQDFDASKVSNTDYLVSILGKGLLTHAKALGYNPTDADATRIEAIIGTIGKDPQALTKILDYQEMMANRAIQRHNQLVAQARQGGVQSAFDLNVSPQTGMPSAQEPSVTPVQPATGSGFTIVGVR